MYELREGVCGEGGIKETEGINDSQVPEEALAL